MKFLSLQSNKMIPLIMIIETSDNIKCPYCNDLDIEQNCDDRETEESCNNLDTEQIDTNSSVSKKIAKKIVKNGVIKYKGKERQRYLCKKCNSNFYHKFTESKIDKCRQAIIMYLEGVAINEIGDLLNVDRGSVRIWINKCGKSISLQSIRNCRMVNKTKIEGVLTVSKKKDNNDPFVQNHFDSFSIIEKNDRTYLSFLKGDKSYKQNFDIKIRKIEANEEGYYDRGGFEDL